MEMAQVAIAALNEFSELLTDRMGSAKEGQ
jgi:hypothetical protein